MIIRSENLDFNDTILNILNNTRMSFKSKGLLLWILSQPNDFILTGKEVSKRNKIYPIGLYSSFDELESLGYIKSNIYDSNIPQDEITYTVYDKPISLVSVQHKKRIAEERAMNDATFNFIKRYLKPNRHFKRVDSISNIYHNMINPTSPGGVPLPVDWSQVCDYILDSLTYDEFLSTEYWEIISYYVKITRNFTCESCGKRILIMSKLNVHHKTYDHHGEEHRPEIIENDLSLLCEDCHKEYHIKINQIMNDEIPQT